MNDGERDRIAQQLFAVLFSLRPDDGEKGQAWILGTCSAAMARAILGCVGPKGDPSTLLQLTGVQVAQAVNQAQSGYMRAQLAKGVAGS